MYPRICAVKNLSCYRSSPNFHNHEYETKHSNGGEDQRVRSFTSVFSLTRIVKMSLGMTQHTHQSADCIANMFFFGWGWKGPNFDVAQQMNSSNCSGLLLLS